MRMGGISCEQVRKNLMAKSDLQQKKLDKLRKYLYIGLRIFRRR